MNAPAFAVTVLRALAGKRLVKVYSTDRQGRVLKSGSDKAAEFALERHEPAGADDFFLLLQTLEQRTDACIVRGAPGPWCPSLGQPMFRLLHPQPAYADRQGRRVSREAARRQGGIGQRLLETIWLPTLVDAPTRWVLLDFEKIDGEVDWRRDLAGTAAWLKLRLPDAFADARCWYQATSSAADPSKPDLGGCEVRMRLAFVLSRPLAEGQLEAWLSGIPGLDPATFRSAQEIYVGRPIFAGGLADPMPERSGVLDGLEDLVEVPDELPPARPREPSPWPVLAVANDDGDGLGLVDSDALEGALARIAGGAGDVRHGLGRAARAYIDEVGRTDVDRSALAARLAREARKHRSAADVAGYNLAGLIQWHLDHARSKGLPDQTGPPPFVQGVALEPAEAAARVEDAVRAWVRQATGHGEEPCHAGIAADPGLGKTSLTLRILAEEAPGKTVHFYVPTHRLGGEVVQRALRVGLEAILIRGREQAIEPGRPERMCAKHDVAAAVGRAGCDVWHTLCRRRHKDGTEEQCEFFNHCPYVRQFAETEGKLVVLAHDYLALPKQRLAEPDLVIIDERFYPSLIRTASLPLGRVTSPRAVTGLVGAEAIAEHLVDAAAMMAAVEAGHPIAAAGVTAETLTAMARLEVMLADLPTISPGQSHADQRRQARQLADTEAYRLARLWRLLAEDLSRAWPSQRVVIRRGCVWREELQDRVFLHWRAALRLPKGVPVLLLDADLDPLIASKVLPLSPEHITRVRVRLNAEVIQIVDTVASRHKLVGADSEQDRRRAERRQAALKALAGIEANRGGAVLLVSYKPVMVTMEPPEGVDRAWFGALRGLDGWKDHAAVIVAGREQPPPQEMEAAARAWFGDDAEPLLLAGSYVPCTRGYPTRDGERRGVVVEVHPDLRVQALLEQQREREIEQAVGRLRLVHRVRQARVLLLTSIPTALTVDRFTTWKEIMPDRLAQAIVRGDGVLPLSATERARLYPDLWPTARAAECDRSRKGGKGTHSPIEYSYWEVSTLSAATLVAYRRPDQRLGSPHRAVLPGRVESKGLAEDLLAAVIGEVDQVRILDVVLRAGVLEAASDILPEPIVIPGLKTIGKAAAGYDPPNDLLIRIVPPWPGPTSLEAA